MTEIHLGELPLRAVANATSLLAIYEDKLVIRRRLAEVDPTNPQWKCDQAEILELIRDEYQRLGMSHAAIRAHQESCIILRELAALDPRNRELHQHFSLSLACLARTEFDSGDLNGAMVHQNESLLVRRKLRKRMSTRAERIAEAWTLAQAADIRSEVGDDEAALEAYEELLLIERELVKSDPSDAHWQWNLSCTLHRIGDLRGVLGDSRRALQVYEESLAIRHSLAGLVDNQTPWLEELCSLLKRIGDLKHETLNSEAALPVYEQRLGTARRLVARHPRSTEWLVALAVSLEDVAAIKARSDSTPIALELYSESLSLRRQLAEIDQLDSCPLQDLCRTLETIAALTRNCDRQKALALYEECVSLRRKLTEGSTFDCLSDFLRTLEIVGELRREEDDKVGAVVAYEELLSLHREAARRSEKSEQRTVLKDLNRIVVLKLDLRDVDGALTAAEESVVVARKLSEIEPQRAWASSRLSEIADITMGAIIRQLSNAELWKEQCKRDLLVSLDQLCSVRFEAGDISGALTSYEEMMCCEDDKAAARLASRANAKKMASAGPGGR
jgi:tetratricopeptide (TPR) repeat protein